jgi:hypothetical protein
MDAWEYETPNVEWDGEAWHTVLPKGESDTCANLGSMLKKWGDEGWELVNIVPEPDTMEVARAHAWAKYRAIFKRRNQQTRWLPLQT